MNHVTKKEDESWPRIVRGLVPANVKVDETEFNPVEEDPDGAPFHMGQIYENESAAPQRCRICKGTAFNVAQGSYFTALRCVKCQWEVCVHEG